MQVRMTFSADREHIQLAREIAKSKGSSLNAELRKWIAQMAGVDREAEKHIKALEEMWARFDAMPHPPSTGGRKFTREEMNTR